MVKLARVAFAVAMTVAVMGQAPARAAALDAVLAKHPAREVLARVLAESATAPADASPSGMSRKDYLPLIAANVDYWKHFQDEQGAIIDPYEHVERQYSTPAFAMASAFLVQEAERPDLLERSARAMSFATAALANGRAADRHPDFYIPMLIHARRMLKDRVKPEMLAVWDQQLAGLVPQKIYNDASAGSNWNIVNVSGEFLRRRDGLVPPDQTEAQLAYLEQCLKGHQDRFTPYGMYVDSGSPLAYDAFPRLWLEDALADGAIEGAWRFQLDNWLARGALSGLLMLSPSGEWPHGGRSAHHQWNEAENAAIAEINAVRWKNARRPDIAGAFKRAAHLCLSSMRRWQRPSGEMWIVKNFADPARRHGFEDYSFNSQYNLLPMAMLSIAYQRADDSIAERPIPSEASGYVVQFVDGFHHLVAACGGYYVLIDVGADRRYASTGIQRVHRAGVDLSPFTETPAAERVFGPPDLGQRAGIAAGMEWEGAGGGWHALARFGTSGWPGAARATTGTGPAREPQEVRKATLLVDEQTDDRVRFAIRYDLAGEEARAVEEQYTITREGVEQLQAVGGEGPARIAFPALVNDGARDTEITIRGNRVRITRQGALVRDPTTDPERPWLVRAGGVLKWELLDPEATLALAGPRLATHNGYVQAIRGDLPIGTRQVRWKMTLDPEAADSAEEGVNKKANKK